MFCRFAKKRNKKQKEKKKSLLIVTILDKSCYSVSFRFVFLLLNANKCGGLGCDKAITVKHVVLMETSTLLGIVEERIVHSISVTQVASKKR